ATTERRRHQPHESPVSMPKAVGDVVGGKGRRSGYGQGSERISRPEIDPHEQGHPGGKLAVVVELNLDLGFPVSLRVQELPHMIGFGRKECVSLRASGK